MSDPVVSKDVRAELENLAEKPEPIREKKESPRFLYVDGKGLVEVGLGRSRRRTPGVRRQLRGFSLGKEAIDIIEKQGYGNQSEFVENSVFSFASRLNKFVPWEVMRELKIQARSMKMEIPDFVRYLVNLNRAIPNDLYNRVVSKSEEFGISVRELIEITLPQ